MVARIGALIFLLFAAGCAAPAADDRVGVGVDIGNGVRIYVDEQGYAGYRVWDPRYAWIGGYRHGGATALPVDVINAGRPCHPVYREERRFGRRVVMAATRCYDRLGQPYLLRGSRHVVGEAGAPY